MSVGLDLKSGVVNAVVVSQEAAGSVEHRVCFDIAGRHEVDGSNVHLRGEGPHVEIVNIPDTVHCQEIRPQGVNIKVGWGSLRQNPEGLAPQVPGSRHDEQPNQRREQRIGVAPAGRHRDDGSCNDPDGTDQVGDHLVVRRPSR